MWKIRKFSLQSGLELMTIRRIDEVNLRPWLVAPLRYLQLNVNISAIIQGADLQLQ